MVLALPVVCGYRKMLPGFGEAEVDVEVQGEISFARRASRVKWKTRAGRQSWTVRPAVWRRESVRAIASLASKSVVALEIVSSSFQRLRVANVAATPSSPSPPRRTDYLHRHRL